MNSCGCEPGSFEKSKGSCWNCKHYWQMPVGEEHLDCVDACFIAPAFKSEISEEWNSSNCHSWEEREVGNAR